MADNIEPSADDREATADPRKVWEIHHRWLRTVIWSRLGEPQAVDEVLQEVALGAARGLPAFADPAKAGPWLYRVAVRQVLLHRRRAGRQRRLKESFAAEGRAAQHDGLGDPLNWLLAEEQRDVVRRALGRLPTREVEILMLKYTEDWTYHQLAQHLGVSVSAVEARLHRARKHFRSALAVLDPTLQPTG